MLPEIIIDDQRIREELGFSIRDNNMQNLIFLDHPSELIPVLVKKPDGSKTIIVRNIESNNYFNGGRNEEYVKKANADIVLYDNYFLMETTQECPFPVFGTEGDALRDGIGAEEASVSDSMPYERFNRFAKRVKLELIPTENLAAVYHAYEIDQNYVNLAFTRVNPREVELATKLLRENTHLQDGDVAILEKYMNSERTDLFSVLNDLMKEENVEQLLVDSISSVHLLSALPWAEMKPGKMFVHYDGKKAVLFCEDELQLAHLRPVGKYDGFKNAVDALCGDKRVGVETKNMPVGRVYSIGEDRVFDISTMFGLWRTRQTRQFLALYVINAQADIWAINQCVQFAESQFAAGQEFTEHEVALMHKKFLQQFADEHQFDQLHLTISQYSDVFHCGTRSIRPAIWSDYKVGKDEKTMKIDVGSMLFRDDIMMAGSDLARSCCFTPEAKQAYKILGESLRNGCMSKIKGGMSGDEIYWLGMEGLTAREDELKAIHAMPENFSLKESYKRDIGHCIDKQVTYNVAIERGEQSCFETLMAGNLEYQWPYREFGLGVEDTYFITPEGTFNLVY